MVSLSSAIDINNKQALRFVQIARLRPHHLKFPKLSYIFLFSFIVPWIIRGYDEVGTVWGNHMPVFRAIIKRETNMDTHTTNLTYFEHLLLNRLSKGEVKGKIQEIAHPYRELMAYYRCAMMSMETKFQVLNEELSLQYDRNPIESIKTRLKSPESLLNKMIEKQLPLTVESIENNINDVAGVRVICSYVSDIYMLADVLLKQDDIVLVKRKDYIANPKENGYRSLHLIVQIPIFLHDKKRMMKVEVQFRTISMDCWASLEHKIRYKKDVHISPEIAEDLRSCAEICEVLDQKMEAIQNKVRPASL